MVGLNTDTPAIYWNGAPVLGVVDIRTDWDADEPRVKIRVTGADPVLVASLRAGGVTVKEV